MHCPLPTKGALLEYLANLAEKNRVGLPAAILQEKLHERELTMSTGIGNGVGVPHTLVEGIHGLHAFVITLEKSISFDSVDHKPVCVVFGLFGNPENAQLSLSALATLGRILRDEDFVQNLCAASSPKEIYGMLKEKESIK